MNFSGVAPPFLHERQQACGGLDARGIYLFEYIAAMRDCDDYDDTRRMRGGGEPRVTIRAQAGSEPRAMLPEGPGKLMRARRTRRLGTRGLTSDAHEPGRCYILTIP